MPIAPDYKPLMCPHCRRQLALATPTRLLFDQGSYCESKVTLRCSTCGTQKFWCPAQSIDTPGAIGYTRSVPA